MIRRKFTQTPVLLATLLFGLLIAAVMPALAGGTAPDRVPVQILALNDFHGHLLSGQKVHQRPVGGAAVLAACLKAAQGGFPGPSFIVSAGDLVGASPPPSALLQDEPAVSFFNLLGNRFCSPGDRYQPRCNLVATLGNHEFDRGVRELKRLWEGGTHPGGPFLENPWKGAAFPVVAANVVRRDTGGPLFPPYVIREAEGIPLAFVGAVVKDTKDMVLPSLVAEVDFLEEAEAINKAAAELQKQGVRAIAVLLHQGGFQKPYEGPTRAAGKLAGPIKNILWQLDDEVDVVISGHTHAFTNVLVPNRNGKQILVTQAWCYGRAFADIRLELSRESKDVVKKSATIVTAWADAGPGLNPDPEAARLTAAAEAKVVPLTSRKVGEAAVPLSRTPNRAGETALGNLVADAMRRAMEADIALMNPGGLRADLPAGEITWGMLYAVLPFQNKLVKLELTGEQIHQLLEQQFPPHQPYPRMLQISGFRYTWDAARPSGRKVVEVLKDGLPLDRKAVYTVVTNSFLAEGGDRFGVFTQGVGKVAGPVDLEAVVDYLGSLPQPFRAEVEGRIERRNGSGGKGRNQHPGEGRARSGGFLGDCRSPGVSRTPAETDGPRGGGDA